MSLWTGRSQFGEGFPVVVHANIDEHVMDAASGALGAHYEHCCGLLATDVATFGLRRVKADSYRGRYASPGVFAGRQSDSPRA